MINICQIENCEKVTVARGLCNKHYQRLRLTGTTDVKRSRNPEEKREFIREASFNLGESCVEWPWGLGPTGYGVVSTVRGPAYVHRISLEIKMGREIGPDLLALHSCDNRRCLNGSHLREGTYQENMQDKANRGRHHNSLKTECPQGHPYSDENTYTSPQGVRTCKVCRRAKARTRYHNKREAHELSYS